MILRERLIEALKDSPKTNKELRQITGKNCEIISATVALNKNVFVRVDKGVVGLRGRDPETTKSFKPEKLCLYKKLVNLLEFHELRYEDIHRAMPEVNKTSIRATINMHPKLFIRLSQGVVGRRNRDEHLVEKYQKLALHKRYRPVPGSIPDKLIVVLRSGEKSIKEMCKLLPEVNRTCLVGALNITPVFEKCGKNVWRLKR